MGIIPRVIQQIFSQVEKRKKQTEVILKVSFLEIYNEEIHDLLDSQISSYRAKNKNPGNIFKNQQIGIREEKDGQINIYGITEEKVTTFEEMINCLEKGALLRSTSSTNMNEQSSRSHAIFTIFIE